MALISQEQLALIKPYIKQPLTMAIEKMVVELLAICPSLCFECMSLGYDSVLDYGTGKGKLVANLRQSTEGKLKIDGYDPAVEQWSTRPDDVYDIVTIGCLRAY